MHFWGGWKSKKRQSRSDTKLKSYVNYQMSHSVVQENNNGNSKIFNNLAKNFVYFLSVFMKDPVGVVYGLKKKYQRVDHGPLRGGLGVSVLNLSQFSPYFLSLPNAYMESLRTLMGIFGPKTDIFWRAKCVFFSKIIHILSQKYIYIF